MRRARARVAALTGRSQVGMELKVVIERPDLYELMGTIGYPKAA